MDIKSAENLELQTPGFPRVHPAESKAKKMSAPKDYLPLFGDGSYGSGRQLEDHFTNMLPYVAMEDFLIWGSMLRC